MDKIWTCCMCGAELNTPEATCIRCIEDEFKEDEHNGEED